MYSGVAAVLPTLEKPMSAAKQIPIAEGLFTWPSNDPRLLGSRCGACGIVTFPAQKSCPACSGQNVETIEPSRVDEPAPTLAYDEQLRIAKRLVQAMHAVGIDCDLAEAASAH